MAIIACKECAREVSDKAGCCPHCGVAIAAVARRKPRFAPWLIGTLLAGIVVWAAATTLWLTGTITVPKLLAGIVGSHGTVLTARTPEKAAELAPPLVAVVQSAAPAKPQVDAVYRTSVEQLYQDYDANEVAILSKIGDSPIRVSGSVAQINEDLSGHPVVTLHAGSSDRADMVLTDNQRSAAAQLSKEDVVDIQCTKVQRIEAKLHGSGCALVQVDAGAKLVYFAVSLSDKAGNAPLYIVGPMSRATCAASGDTIAAQLTLNPKTDHVLSKQCGATARENVPLDGCRLNSTMSAVPDIPTAHLWKYDCAASEFATPRAADTAVPKSPLNRAAALAFPAAAITGVARPSVGVVRSGVARQPTPTAISAAADSDVISPVAAAPTPVPVPLPVQTLKVQPDVVLASPAAAPPEPSLVRTAVVDPPPTPSVANAGDLVSPPAQLAAAVVTSTSAVPLPAPVADDLVPVRTKDPEAADKIVSYCGKITSAAANPTQVAARCRQDEMGAWNRFVVQNEFPTLDENSRRKCNEPPFPDSFVARESCAKYQLHLD